MRLKPGSCVHHSCPPMLFTCGPGWIKHRTHIRLTLSLQAVITFEIWALPACYRMRTFTNRQNTKEGSHKGNIPRQSIPAAQSSSLSLGKQGVRVGKTGPLQQQWLRGEGIQAWDQKTGSKSDEQGCLPCSLLQMLWKKPAGQKVFLGVQLTKNSRRKHSCLLTKDYEGLLLSRAQKTGPFRAESLLLQAL